MKLKTIVVNNFMPFYGEQEVSFPQDRYANVMIVFAENMRGKTSLLNALRWGFYGKATGRHGRLIASHELLNWKAKREGRREFEVCIRFESDGHSYELRRRASYRRLVAEASRDSDLETSVSMLKDGIPMAFDKVEPEVNSIVPESVSRFFLFDGELLQEYEELLFDNSDQGKRIAEEIEQILGVPALVQARDNLDVVLRAARREAAEAAKHHAGVRNFADRQEALANESDKCKSDIGSLQELMEGYRTELADVETFLDAASEATVAELGLKETTSAIERERNRLRDLARDRKAVMSDAWKDLVLVKLEVRRQQQRHAYEQMLESAREHERRVIRVDNLRRMLEDRVCPACGQPTLQPNREKIAEDLASLEAIVREQPELIEEMAVLGAKLQALSNITSVAAGARLNSIRDQESKSEVELVGLERRQREYQEHLEGHDSAQVAKARVTRRTLDEEIGRTKVTIENRRKDLDKLDREMQVNQAYIESKSGSSHELSNRRVHLVQSLHQLFGDGVERLRESLRVEVERKATEAFLKLTTQSNYRSLRINDRYGLSIVDATGRTVALRSAGAEQVVALSLIDGLNRTGRSAGPVIMDTPFGRLDLAHRDNVLRYMPSAASQLVLFVHSGEIRPESDLAVIGDRIGSSYEIVEDGQNSSRIVRI